MPHIVVLFLHTFCEQIHFQPFLPTEYLYTLIFWVYKRISGWLFWKSIHFIQDETFENEFLYHLFFLFMYWSRVEITVNSAVKRNLDAHWPLNHFDSLHTKQESKLTLVFPCSISGSTTENTIKCGNVSTGENIRKVHETKVSEISSPYQNSRH